VACSLARDHGARVIAVHVMTPPTAYGETGVFVAVEHTKPALLADLRQLRSPSGDVAIDHRLAEGDPAGEIIRLAEETDCDLIVMGTHGRKGLGRLLMGSVAENVMRRAPCPVLTVKATVRETAPLLAQALGDAASP
jgi:nucleotide-binding universal stress UspA family protein